MISTIRGQLNIEMLSYQYRNSYPKYRMVSWASYLYKGNLYTFFPWHYHHVNATNPSDEKSTLALVMTWCHQATSHNLIQCWPSSVMLYDIIRGQWVNMLTKSTCLWRPVYKVHGTVWSSLLWLENLSYLYVSCWCHITVHHTCQGPYSHLNNNMYYMLMTCKFIVKTVVHLFLWLM